MSFKKPKLTAAGVLTGIGPGAPTPTAQLKNGSAKLTADKVSTEPTEAQLALEAQQREDSAKLDAQENERRKRLLSAMQGVRAFSGSSIFRGNQASQNSNATVTRTGTGGGRMFVGGSGSSSMGDAGVTASNSR